MAAMWILLKNPHNRNVLSTAFSQNPANTITRDIQNKLQDAIDVYAVQDSLEPTSNAELDIGRNAIIDSSKEYGCSPEPPSTAADRDNLQDTDPPEASRISETPDVDQDLSGNQEPRTGRSGSNKSDCEGHSGNNEDDDFAAENSLEDGWGLDTLVRVGENWLPRILQLNVSCDDSDAPLLKLFEFLSASLCLFLVGNENDQPVASSSAHFEYGELLGSKR